MSLPLSAQIEAILFFRGEPTSINLLSSYTQHSEEEVREALRQLGEQLNTRGIVLIQSAEGVTLGTHAEAHHLIESITKEELTRDLGKAGLETLAIIMYKGKASKKEIDYIRGVNSGFIIRNLLIRGLIRREEESDDRSFSYSPTAELLAFMGISKVEDIPEYEAMREEMDRFISKSEEPQP